MAIEIAIDELGIGNDKVAYVKLPANRNEVIDAMDREKIFGETFLRITECDEVPELEGYEFSEEPTLDELNFLAKRLEEISEEKTQIIAYQALLKRGFGTINEAINRTYNLETIPVYPCINAYSYGEIVLENEMLEGLCDVPDEIYELLDPDKVGRAMVEKENGIFIDKYYAIANSYEPVLEYDEQLPERMEDWIFRLEVAGVPERAEDFHKMKTETLTLPADEQYMQDIAEALGERNIDECVSMKFESMIPHINNGTWNMEEIYLLNDIAREYSEMSREDAAKFKAVLRKEQPDDLDGVRNVLNSLDQYEVDISINNYSEYGSKYLSKMLPPDFDRTLLKGACTAEFAQKLMCANNCTFNEYGVVSERGGHLYTMIETADREELQSPELSL